MKTHISLLVTGLLLSAAIARLHAQGTAFTYQGRLDSNGNPASGHYDFQFVVCDAGGGPGTEVTGTNTFANVAVTNGLFTVTPDFGAVTLTVFNGQELWLAIFVRTNGTGAYTALLPRQFFMPTPYAITAENLNGTLGNGNLSGTYGNAVTLSSSANHFTGAYAGNGGGLTNVNAASLGGLASSNFWKLAGNSGANPTNGNFLGSTDNLPLELRVNGSRALRLEPVANDVNHSNVVNVIGGSSANFAGASAHGATISGGGARNESGFLLANSVTANYGTVGGGGFNTVAANYAAIGGGFFNGIDSNADYSVIAGGSVNKIQTNSNNSVIVGGGNNTVQTDSDSSFIGGGSANSIQTSNGLSVIVGGGNNKIMKQFFAANPSVTYAAIGGGKNNTIQNSAYSVIGGGGANAIVPSLGSFGNTLDYNTISGGSGNTNFGFYCTIGGGQKNTHLLNAGATIAGGQLNTCSQDNATIGGGAFNTASGHSATVPGGENNTASGDFSFATGVRAKATHTGSFVWADDRNFDFASTATNKARFRCTGGFDIVTAIDGSGTQTAGVFLGAGGNSWATISDRNAKKNFAPVDAVAMLDKLAAIAVERWNYKWEDNGAVPHLGPMAQDFKAAFYPGRDDKSISTLEFDGVELAAIQGLNQKLAEKEARIKAMEKELAELKRLVDKLSNKTD